MIELNKWNGRNVEEDELLDENVLKLIKNRHGEITKIARHYRIKNLECDAIIYTITKNKKLLRTIGIEIKENPYDLKVVEQAVARRKFFHYFYILTHEPFDFGMWLKYIFRSDGLRKIEENNIGWIMKNDDVKIIYPSNMLVVNNITKWWEND